LRRNNWEPLLVFNNTVAPENKWIEYPETVEPANGSAFWAAELASPAMTVC